MSLGAAADLGSVWRVAELRVGVAGSVVAVLAPVPVLLGICGVPEGGRVMHMLVKHLGVGEKITDYSARRRES